ncbi:hypothetical protein K0M31_015403, partial [Melipona bicolor]
MKNGEGLERETGLPLTSPLVFDLIYKRLRQTGQQRNSVESGAEIRRESRVGTISLFPLDLLRR